MVVEFNCYDNERMEHIEMRFKLKDNNIDDASIDIFNTVFRKFTLFLSSLGYSEEEIKNYINRYYDR